MTKLPHCQAGGCHRRRLKANALGLGTGLGTSAKCGGIHLRKVIESVTRQPEMREEITSYPVARVRPHRGHHVLRHVGLSRSSSADAGTDAADASSIATGTGARGASSSAPAFSALVIWTLPSGLALIEGNLHRDPASLRPFRASSRPSTAGAGHRGVDRPRRAHPERGRRPCSRSTASGSRRPPAVGGDRRAGAQGRGPHGGRGPRPRPADGDEMIEAPAGRSRRRRAARSPTSAGGGQPHGAGHGEVARKTLDSEDHRRLIEEALSEVDFDRLSGARPGRRRGRRRRWRRGGGRRVAVPAWGATPRPVRSAPMEEIAEVYARRCSRRRRMRRPRHDPRRAARPVRRRGGREPRAAGLPLLALLLVPGEAGRHRASGGGRRRALRALPRAPGRAAPMPVIFRIRRAFDALWAEGAAPARGHRHERR